MTFTYSASAVATSTLWQIRLEIGDNAESGSIFDDAELTQFYSAEGSNVLKASARALETLAQTYSRKASFNADGLSINWANTAQQARDQAKELRKRASGTSKTIKMVRHDGFSHTIAAGS